jgi:subtilase family serine protease
MGLGEVGGGRLLRRVCIVAAASAGILGAGAAQAIAASPVARAAMLGAAPAAQRLQLVLPLVADGPGLERFARAVTTPGSADYGEYESISRLAARFGAPAWARRAVVRYLQRAGARAVKIDATGLFADATINAGLAQRLFRAPLARFRTARSASFIAPTATATVPAGLRGLITGVVGLDTRSLVSSRPAISPAERASITAHAADQPSSVLLRSGTSSGCGDGQAAGEVDANPATAGFTPNQYLTAYGFAGMQAAGFKGQGERVALIEIDGFKSSDIRAFAACFGLDVPAVHAFGVGTTRALAPGGESTLDLEVLDAAAPDLSEIDVYETKPDAATTLRALTAPLQNHGHHPQVISASLGLCEPAVLGAVGIHGIQATERALSMAAASGITVLASSGDQGSADCTGPDGLPARRLAVNYPASSPWVTGVGGTNLELDATNQIAGQIVWNDAGAQPGSAAGGGLSTVFRRPWYQNGTVSANARAVPDVSLLADIVPGFAVFCSALRDCINASNSAAWQSVGGTSAATPLLAGGFALVDQDLRMQRREDLGLVNPLLYSIGRSPALSATAFSDVIAGGNDVGPFIGGGQPLGCCQAGPGFDLASGWGSIDIANFTAPALRMQPPQLGLSLPRRQRPVKHRRILATVSCAGGCRIGAYADVRIGRKQPFEVDSSVHRLAAAGSKTIPIRFSKRELGRLRSALAGHRRIVATIFGVAVAGRRTIQARTGGEKLTITR